MTSQEISKTIPILESMTATEIADGIAATSRLINAIQVQITKILKEMYFIELGKQEVQEKLGVYSELLAGSLLVNSAVVEDAKSLIEDIRQYEQYVQALDGTQINLLNPDEAFLSALSEFTDIEPTLSAVSYAEHVGQVGKFFGKISESAKLDSEAMDRIYNVFDLTLRLRAKVLKSVRDAFVGMTSNAEILSNSSTILNILNLNSITVSEFISKSPSERMVIVNESNA